MPPPLWGSTGHGYIKDNGEENLTKHKYNRDKTSQQRLTKTLPMAQRTQGIEYFDPFNTFSLMQKLQQVLNLGQTSAWFCLGKGEKYIE